MAYRTSVDVFYGMKDLKENYEILNAHPAVDEIKKSMQEEVCEQAEKVNECDCTNDTCESVKEPGNVAEFLLGKKVEKECVVSECDKAPEQIPVEEDCDCKEDDCKCECVKKPVEESVDSIETDTPDMEMDAEEVAEVPEEEVAPVIPEPEKKPKYYVGQELQVEVVGFTAAGKPIIKAVK